VDGEERQHHDRGRSVGPDHDRASRVAIDEHAQRGAEERRDAEGQERETGRGVRSRQVAHPDREGEEHRVVPERGQGLFDEQTAEAAIAEERAHRVTSLATR
jgi:hypothetical protein